MFYLFILLKLIPGWGAQDHDTRFCRKGCPPHAGPPRAMPLWLTGKKKWSLEYTHNLKEFDKVILRL